MNKKAALELSLNFIVILIISIVVFSFGIYLMSKFFQHGNDVIFEWDQKNQEALDDLMDRGDKVAILSDHKYIGNKKTDAFPIGIFNMLGAQHTFSTYISFSKAYDKEGNLLCDSSNTAGCGINPDNWLKSATGTVEANGIKITSTINNYEKAKFLVGVSVTGAKAGQYLFKVDVKKQDGTLYDDKSHIIIVEVNY